MLWPRTLLNAVLANTLPLLDQAPVEVVGRAFGSVRWMLRRAGVSLPAEIDPRLIRDTIRIFADAVVCTPHGQPLELRYPLLATVSGSTYCPFRCANCYSDSGTHRGADTGSASWTPWHEAIARSPVPFVFLTGGEPAADPGTAETAERFLSAGKWVYISSNASIARLLDIKRRYPHSLFFVLPLWGRGERHDELRGHGSFHRLCENLRLLTVNGLSGELLVVMSNDDLRVLDTVSELADRYKINSVKINRKVSVGRENADSLQASPDFLEALRRKVKPLRSRLTALSIDLPETRAQARHPALLRWLGIPAFPSCSAGRWMMHLDDRGRVYPCYTFERTQHYDDSQEESLEQRWMQVRQGRERLGYSDPCIGEAYARLTQSQRRTTGS